MAKKGRRARRAGRHRGRGRRPVRVRRSRKAKLVFGVELEVVDRTRLEVAKALNYEFGGYIEVWSDEEYENQMPRENEQEDKEDFLLHFTEKTRPYRFQIVEDESLKSPRGDLYRAEVILGPLEERDLDMVRRACKTLLIAGAKSNESCGVHVHFSSDIFDGASLRRLIAFCYMYEPILFRALQVSDARQKNQCKPIHEGFAREVLSSTDEVLTIMKKWYDIAGSGLTKGRFDPVRTFGLNLNPEPLKNHYELRYFNGTLEPDAVLSYVHLALGMLRYSMNRRNSITLSDAIEKRQAVLAAPNTHYREFTALLDRMGLGSRRYARSRDMFLKNL
jgi:hypothetical protein